MRVKERYKLLTELGGGSFSVVYRAQQVGSGREVAIKLPNVCPLAEAQHANEQNILERLHKDGLSHKNVVAFIEASQDPLALVLELCPGRELFYWITSIVFSNAEKKFIACEILAGLKFLHENGIVHADLKPENIQVRGRHSVKLVDFGMAKLLSGPDDFAIVETGGTLMYAAAEVVSKSVVSFCCDIWALAVVVVVMITGAHAYPSSDSQSLRRIYGEAKKTAELVNFELYDLISQGAIPSLESISDDLAALLRTIFVPCFSEPVDGGALQRTGRRPSADALLAAVKQHRPDLFARRNELPHAQPCPAVAAAAAGFTPS